MPGTPLIRFKKIKKAKTLKTFKAPKARSRGADVYIQKLQLLVVSHAEGIRISVLGAWVLRRDTALCVQAAARTSRGMGTFAR